MIQEAWICNYMIVYMIMNYLLEKNKHKKAKNINDPGDSLQKRMFIFNGLCIIVTLVLAYLLLFNHEYQYNAKLYKTDMFLTFVKIQE